MTITAVASHELSQGNGRAKRAALSGPVFITDRGKPAHVLLSLDDYQRLTQQHRSIAEALAMEGLADIDLDRPKLRIEVPPVDLS